MSNFILNVILKWQNFNSVITHVGDSVESHKLVRDAENRLDQQGKGRGLCSVVVRRGRCFPDVF